MSNMNERDVKARTEVVHRPNTVAMRIAGVVNESIVDGPGLRMTVFFQGCPHQCPGCHNPHTHDENGGEIMDTADVVRRFRANPLLSGITLSGGEPLEQPAAAMEIAEAVKADGKSVMVYTGYRWEDVFAMSENTPAVRGLLKHTDILVDGRYVQANKTLNLPFRGSLNQRLIDVQRTMALDNVNTVVEWEL